MKIRVLGSAAGGGFPQWNCNCRNCKGYREGQINAHARTQSSICISSDGERWLLFNASPDIRAQMASFKPLQPARKLRDTGIEAVMLIDAQIDHTSGLLMLREGCPLNVYCTDPVYEDLSSGFPLFPMLESWNGGLQRHPVSLDSDKGFEIPAINNLRIHAIALSSKAPPYSPHRNNPVKGDNIGVFIEDLNTGGSLFYAPGLGAIESHLLPWMERADCLLVDGTLWRDDEMICQEVGTQTGLSMGHLPQSGAGGMLETLFPLPARRKILIHINNTNPILDEDSPERAELNRQGIEVANDGLEIDL
ncbi:pyrroloquinoline quinone biosynthesis protein PqqB [Motiliproteus sp. MSK22-1]|uniref:pyrroloquinoline quinone biosynthesis protein PqqB n=1 Tax=Motiliproteus sp. MSK22-1 TaxID=1897630 RepID=UPI00097691CD|nr:pyrroloquinoline quinone biosynthesis protein PqqB [Motiliproteus sp. MSK22-1]OMH39696.1 pyrroloquinoline quinone biosynthesis protein PqqB [Motiliproteus sp. MSK22-1]